MPENILQALLAGTWRDPESGAPLSVPVRSIVIADGVAGTTDGLVRALDLGRRFAVVSDPDTHAVLGGRVERALSVLGTVQAVRLPARPHADDATATRLGAATASADALVAVGSGTINDLCKIAAFRGGKPYVVFGTAPSMNGYGSANAAITVRGVKASLAARAPAGIFLDLRVLAAAPPRMIRSGLGDSLCRPTAQADWLLSHLLRDTPYREAPFALLAPDEPALLADPGALLAGDLEAMARLARTLVLSGLGMGLAGGSHPASEGEHLISHYVEIMGGPDLPGRLHGEQIGVTTLTMARLQGLVLGAPRPPIVRPTAIDPGDIARHFGPERASTCLREFGAKALTPEAAERINDRISGRWPEIRDRIRAVLRPADALRRALVAAGAPTSPAELGWPAAFYRTALLRARQIRNRYTFLDLAGDAGVLDRFARREG